MQRPVGRLLHGPIGENWAHLCVDMQVMFTDATEWETPWLPRVLPNVERLVAIDPRRTIFTRFVPPHNPSERHRAWRRYWERWHTMTQAELPPASIGLLPSLERFVPPAKVIDKAVYGAWDGQLEGFLDGRQIDTLVVSGTETEMCVLATVMGAVDRGYRVIIASDAVCSSADETHDAMMLIYQSRFSLQVETATAAQIEGELKN